MLDVINILASGGSGGAGCISFRREKYIPRGGPDGGLGGHGGSVHLYASRTVRTLGHFRHMRVHKAEAGRPGGGRKRAGKSGADLRIEVPIGTMVWRVLGQQQEYLGDLSEGGQEICVAHGGVGGRGNVAFATPTNRTPLLAERGETGEESPLKLEVRLLCDLAIVGQPNAGKSSFLRAATAAKPQVAAFPFTTTEPILGVAEIDRQELVLMEIPGLISGASSGVGLGLEFLRHVDRARGLIHVLDGSREAPEQDLEDIRREIESYDPQLLQLPVVIAINKIDLPEAREALPTLRVMLESRGFLVQPISAAAGIGIEEVLRQASTQIERTRGDTHVPPSPEPRHTPTPKPRPSVHWEEGVLVVESKRAIRIAEGSDCEDGRVRLQLWRELLRMGVVREMEKVGAKHGDRVGLGLVEMEYP